MNSNQLTSVVVSLCLLGALTAGASDLPMISKAPQGGQLIIHGKPYLILGGELSNSAAGTASQADTILPHIAQMHVNTVLMPVAWEQIEPSEGKFDFTILDHWIDVAREQHLHLVLLWFGSWKNGFSNYAPTWVKRDTNRFPRADRPATEILSTLGTETLKADERAFSTLMTHVKQKDQEQQTVLMVQVENEVGYLGQGRDRSAAANQLFQDPVPQSLLQKLTAQRFALAPELRAHFNPDGKTWRDVFGDAADEVFMAWNYARYIQAVTAAGKSVYPLPMYVNCQLPAPGERAGEYPSGGPHPYYLDVYRVTAPSLDFFSPDIYWPNFEYWLDRYRLPGNAIFVPEARMEPAPYNALYAFGESAAFGFSPFSIDNLHIPADSTNQPMNLADVYEALDHFGDSLLAAQTADRTRGLVLHSTSPRPTQSVAIGGYLMEATLSRSWPARTLSTDDGAMLVLHMAADQFYIVGSGLTVSFHRDADVDNKICGIASIEEMAFVNGNWTVRRRLNGDESNQGRQLLMDAHRLRVYRVELYTAEPNQR